MGAWSTLNSNRTRSSGLGRAGDPSAWHWRSEAGATRARRDGAWTSSWLPMAHTASLTSARAGPVIAPLRGPPHLRRAATSGGRLTTKTLRPVHRRPDGSTVALLAVL